MEKICCQQCKYYRQHYTLDSQRILRVYCGHCTNPTAKHKRPHTAACNAFVPGTPDEDTFVSKEFLTKALLQRVLDMDLLPPIEDALKPKIR
ncbi:MAG: hypothetical protein E7470_01695 [Ruminococcaceae bacterium]|nr:hypothetical protein [Oscillospiraceae bacterium]